MGRNLIVRTLAVLAVPMSCALAFAVPASAAPPAGGTGGIVGTVTAADGSPLDGACVSTDTGFSTTTDVTGTFHLTGVSTGGHVIRVEDCAGHTQTSEWFDGVDAFEKAQTIWVYPGSDTPVPPITLRAGAFISGTVKNDAGPVGAYCVVASMDGTTFAKGTTVASGSFTVGPLPPGSYLVQFVDCRGLPDPYQLQWSPSSTDQAGAKPIAVLEGQTATGVDQNLDHVSGGGGGSTPTPDPKPDPDPDSGAPAVSVIGGRVTDGSGNPLQDICVVAFTLGSTAGSAQTDSTGNYKMDLNTTQPVKVQFVDCTGSAKFAGQWFPNRPTESAGDPVVAPPGSDRSGIDAALVPGAPGSISGTVLNRRGHPMAGACVVAYLPYRYTVPALVEPDGSFTITGVPSGTYALGVLTCRDDDKDPLPWVDDPDTPGLRYAAAFWPHGTIRFDQGQVDPWTGGGKRIAVAPGQQLSGYDQCFGCVGITVDQVTPGHGTVTLAFTAETSQLFDPSMLSADAVSVANADADTDVMAASAATPTITYTATCRSSTGGVTGSATSTTSPITVTGLTPGGTYTCSISAADAEGALGSSDETGAVVASSTGEADVPTDDTPTELAATGNGLTTGLAVAGWTAWIAGLALTAVARSRRDQDGPSVRRPRTGAPGR